MVPHTRRRLLQGAAALAAGLAGCNGSSSGVSSSNHPDDAENLETDPEGYALRNADNAPVAWFASSETSTAPPTTEREPRISERETGLVATAERASRLRFADVDGVDGARSFVEETDFDRETVLLETRLVRECFRLDLCAITWSATSYHTYFGRTYRPADVACRTDANDRVAQLVRIPDTLDPDAVTSHGSGSTSGSCAKFRHAFERRMDERGSDGDTSPGGAR